MNKINNRVAEYFDDASWLDRREDCKPILTANQVLPRIRATSGEGIVRFLTQHQELARLRLENAKLRKAAADESIRILRELIGRTCETFGCEIIAYEDFDPEYPADKYTVLRVTTSLPPERVVEAEQKWIRSLREIAPSNWQSVRLLVEAT